MARFRAGASCSPELRADGRYERTAAVGLIPIYDHGRTIGGVVEELEESGKELAGGALRCLIVDDGSGAETRDVLAELARRYEWVQVERLERNSGKGAALRHGFRSAAAAGATHVIHLDADGQHEIADVRRFVAAISEDPDALVLGKPIFDDSVPGLRLYSRQLSRGIVWMCTLSFADRRSTLRVPGTPARADAASPRARSGRSNGVRAGPRRDPVLWAGLRVINLPTRVRYHQGGLIPLRCVARHTGMARVYAWLMLRAIPRVPALLSRSSLPIPRS